VREAARVYFEAAALIGLDWLHDRVEHLAVDGAWQAVARTELRKRVQSAHRRIAEQVMHESSGGNATERVGVWGQTRAEPLARWHQMLAEMRAAGEADFATLSVALESVRKLAE
jgi:glutamate dehydrogenase